MGMHLLLLYRKPDNHMQQQHISSSNISQPVASGSLHIALCTWGIHFSFHRVEKDNLLYCDSSRFASGAQGFYIFFNFVAPILVGKRVD
jgi:hypothetical protein